MRTKQLHLIFLKYSVDPPHFVLIRNKFTSCRVAILQISRIHNLDHLFIDILECQNVQNSIGMKTKSREIILKEAHQI